MSFAHFAARDTQRIPPWVSHPAFAGGWLVSQDALADDCRALEARAAKPSQSAVLAGNRRPFLVKRALSAAHRCPIRGMRLGVILTVSGLVAVPPLAQTTTRQGIIPAFTPRESAPAFVVECHNDSASAVPWPTIRTIRLDGNDRELVGGIVGSIGRATRGPGPIERTLHTSAARGVTHCRRIDSASAIETSS